jgi:ATP-binding cassette subfamily C protein LapB
MDARTEKTFIDSFRQQKLESTLILITHRTSLLSLVDKVIVIDNGKIVGSGPTAAFLGAKTNSSEREKGDLSALDK